MMMIVALLAVLVLVAVVVALHRKKTRGTSTDCARYDFENPTYAPSADEKKGNDQSTDNTCGYMDVNGGEATYVYCDAQLRD
eukprot:m.70221 g.70221  ORF g.70221 m.70221 type:complete len:82 (+) comp8631_c0_seq1:986-1231(+)